MKTHKPRPLSELLPSYLRLHLLDAPLSQARLLRAYKETVGTTIAHHTTNVYIRGDNLHIHLSSPALRHGLMLQRTALIDRLNKAARQQVIKDILIH